MSLSSRRAWIEIKRTWLKPRRRIRRSPHGERGLKLRVGQGVHMVRASLSSRRAWIEITRNTLAMTCTGVALLTESVD